MGIWRTSRSFCVYGSERSSGAWLYRRGRSSMYSYCACVLALYGAPSMPHGNFYSIIMFSYTCSGGMVHRARR